MNKMRKIRNEMGLSYQEMADLMNLSKMTYWNKENGNSKFDVNDIIAIKKITNTDLNVFLEGFYTDMK